MEIINGNWRVLETRPSSTYSDIEVVLSLIEDEDGKYHHQYATHIRANTQAVVAGRANRGTYWGHYHQTITEAVKDYNER